MTFDEAVQRLESVDHLLADFEKTQISCANAERVLHLVEELNSVKAVIGGLQAYLQQGGSGGNSLVPVLSSIGERSCRLRPILEGGVQYCTCRLTILWVSDQGYSSNGTASPLQMHGEIAEEA
jgi:hypothetical protein